MFAITSLPFRNRFRGQAAETVAAGGEYFEDGILGFMSNVVKFDEKQVMAILNSHGVTDASVFGSFARGDAGVDSDLDLLVTYRQGTTLFDIFTLQDDLEHEVGRKVDLVSSRSISPRLAKRIKDDVRPLVEVV